MTTEKPVKLRDGTEVIEYVLGPIEEELRALEDATGDPPELTASLSALALFAELR